jgi:O-antigen biosynthesis protein
MNENDAYIFDVEMPSRWVFNGSPVWISGWFLSKVGATFTDIRAVIDGVPYYGVLGIPRPEIEQKYRGHTGLPHAGFTLQVRPPIGARELRLELRDAGHRWVEIWRHKLRVHWGPLLKPALPSTLLPYLAFDVLQEMRQNPAADVDATTAEAIGENWGQMLNMLPNPPFFGALEQPGEHCPTQFGKLILLGWLVHLEQPIVRLYGSTHPQVENVIAYGDRPRDDAGRLFPQLPRAARSAFFGMLDIDERAPNPAYAMITAELADGSRHLVWFRRFKQRPCMREERKLPAYSLQTFGRVAKSIIATSRAKKLPLGSPVTLVRGLMSARVRFRELAPAQEISRNAARDSSYEEWLRVNVPRSRWIARWEARAKELHTDGPTFVLLIDATDTPDAARALLDLGESLRRQIYSKWEARVVGPNSAALKNARRALNDPRWSFESCSGRNDRARAFNAAAHQSAGTHISLLRADDRLSPDALLQLASAIAESPNVELVYTDEDLQDDEGRRSEPVFKSDWSPALADSGLFPGRLCVVRRDRFIAAGSFREKFSEVLWYDLLLRLGDRLETGTVQHLPLVCVHGRAGRTVEVDPTHASVEQARQALAEAAARRGWRAQPFLPEAAHRRRRRFHQLRWDPKTLADLPVTIVIPTRDKLHLLQECIERLEETVDWTHVRLIIVDDHSRDADAVHYLEAIQRRTDMRCLVVRPDNPQAPFNYSRLVNLALPHIETPLVLHLNNDVNALESGWLEEMAGWFTLPDVGVVGAKLVYPDKTLNHTGIILGPHSGLADTPLVKQDENTVPEVEWHSAARDVSAVTGACLLTRTDLYRKLGGFDEGKYAVAYNDVDYCLRARDAGQRVIYTPQAKLMHWGSATRGVAFSDEEHIAFAREYGMRRDPFVSPHLHWHDGQLKIQTARPVALDRKARPTLLLVTHNLNLEGAPLFLFEYAAWMVRHGGCRVEVVSCEEGPLRSSFEELGIRITLVDRHPLYASASPEEFEQRLAKVRSELPMDAIDVVVCNTLVGFWAVHLARQAGKPSLWYIHESSSLHRFFHQMLLPAMQGYVREAMHAATRVCFLCEASRAYHEDENVNGNFRIVRSWIRLADIEAFKRAHRRDDLRRKHGFAPDDVVISNIGTICERKGQHIFLRAIDHFRHHQRTGKDPRFVMVGARPGVYLDILTADIARMGLHDLKLVPETREVFDFMLLSDVFVCSSYEESFPRVVLEAMAFRTPIVTTDVHGIPEMVRQRVEAYLVKPGDVAALSTMMRTCLAKERSGKSLTATAYSKVVRYYDYDRVLPMHLELAQEAWIDFPPQPNRR